MPFKGKSAPKPAAKTSDLNQGTNFVDDVINAPLNIKKTVNRMNKRNAELQKQIDMMQ